MNVSERRREILRHLCRRRFDTTANLAITFGVSERTIRRDIEELSLREPIYTQSGRYGGGIYIETNYRMDRMYFTEEQQVVFKKAVHFVRLNNKSCFSVSEIETLEKMLNDYTKPKRQGGQAL